MHRFDEKPFIVIWEMTQACDLTCKHCRACARPERDTRELSTAEGKGLLDQLSEGGVPLVVFTGGDPAKRGDLVELVRHARQRGMNVGLTPSSTPLVTDTLIRELAQAGLGRLAISIDGANADDHDSFRGVAGSFETALRILKTARECGLQTQVNTSVHAKNIDDLAAMVPLIGRIGCKLWSVFYVVPTGRAGVQMVPSAEAVEQSFEFLADLAECAPFSIKTTAAPHYRRVLLQRKQARQHGTRGVEALRVNEGRGFMFVSHLGQVFPSGFLPMDCGNVRSTPPLEIYRTHPVFRLLRDPAALTGKCNSCEYRFVCGGSRARAYAMRNSFLASDPLCSYIPKGFIDGPLGGSRRLPVLSR